MEGEKGGTAGRQVGGEWWEEDAFAGRGVAMGEEEGRGRGRRTARAPGDDGGDAGGAHLLGEAPCEAPANRGFPGQLVELYEV